jgi:hypothetical protein
VKTPIIIALVFASASAFADKNLDKDGAWDCKKDPVVFIGNGAGTYTFKGTCAKISVNGGENKLTIESVDTLDVSGGENTITVGTVGTINVGGSDNKITWKKAKAGDKPVMKGQPDKNTITQGK